MSKSRNYKDKAMTAGEERAMSGEVWMIIIGAILLLCALVAVSCAKVSGQCSDWERQMEARQEAEKDGKP